MEAGRDCWLLASGMHNRVGEIRASRVCILLIVRKRRGLDLSIAGLVFGAVPLFQSDPGSQSCRSACRIKPTRKKAEE